MTEILVSGYQIYKANITLDAAGIVLETVLLASVVNEISSGNRDARHFLYVLLSSLAAQAVNLISCFTAWQPALNSLTRLLISVSGWAVCLYLYFIVTYLISELRKKTFINDDMAYLLAFLSGLAAIVWTIGNTADFELFFTEGEDGTLQALPLAELRFVFILVYYLFGVLLLFSCRRLVRGKDLNYWLLCLLIPVVTLFMPYSLVYIYHFGISVSVLCLYIGIDIERFHNMAQSEKKLTEMKTRLLVSQIQPHFMYNSLNSIYYLIGADPEKAQEALSVFSDYLRRNVNALKTEDLVKIQYEMQHVDAYLYLEKIRFGDKIRVVYDQQEMDFMVPSLSVQPLVENAVKHGISKKKGQGTVTISTFADEENYYVSVADDGLGFSSKEAAKDAQAHTGLRNVAGRIKNMCSGTLKITSEPGKGTRCLISIPRETQRKREKVLEV